MKLEKNKKSKFSFLGKVVNLVSVLILLTLVMSLVRSIGKLRQVEKRIDDMNQTAMELEERRVELQEQFDSSNTDEFVEAELRLKLGFTKPNEITIILPEDDVVRNYAPKIDTYEEVLPEPNWKKWLDLFM